MTINSFRIMSNGILDASGPCTCRPHVIDVDAHGLISYSGGLPAAPATGLPSINIDGLLMPGIVNWHSHAPMAVLRGLIVASNRDEWLRNVWALEASLNEDDVYVGALAAFGEMMRRGITTSIEMYFHDWAIIAAAETAGFRCCITPGVNEAPEFVRRFGNWRTQLGSALDIGNSVSGRPLIAAGLSVHSPYAVSEATFRQVCVLAHESMRPLHFHLAELPADEELRYWRHREFSRAMAAVEINGANIIAAHGVHLLTRDWLKMYDWNALVVLCPRSNFSLGVGIPSVPESCRRHIVRFGTDGALETPLDILQSAIPLINHRAGETAADAWSCDSIIRSSFASAGNRLGFPEPMGKLSQGHVADIVGVAVEPSDLGAAPCRMLNLGECVSDVWVGGR